VKDGETVRAIVLDIDQERRRIRLGLKQLQPTKVDHFIAEHTLGEKISGRIADVRAHSLRVEVAEGVYGECKLEEKKEEAAKPAAASASTADVGSLAEMLKGRWKEGKGGDPTPKAASLRTGMIRNFKISGLDAEQKRVSLELVD